MEKHTHQCSEHVMMWHPNGYGQLMILGVVTAVTLIVVNVAFDAGDDTAPTLAPVLTPTTLAPTSPGDTHAPTVPTHAPTAPTATDPPTTEPINFYGYWFDSDTCAQRGCLTIDTKPACLLATSLATVGSSNAGNFFSSNHPIGCIIYTVGGGVNEVAWNFLGSDVQSSASTGRVCNCPTSGQIPTQN